MEERDPNSTTGFKYFKHFLFQIQKYLTTLFRPQCENKKWSKGTMYFCRDHEKSLCVIWFFVLHSKCGWERNPSKESVQECMAFIKTLMKFMTKWYDECNEKQNNQDLSEELKFFNELLLSIDEKVLNDKIKALTNNFFIFYNSV